MKYKFTLDIARAPTINELQWKGEQAITLYFQWSVAFYRKE